MAGARIGVDIGGTFTDVTVLYEDSGQVTIAKVPSRRDDPGGALLDGIETGLAAADLDPAEVTLLVHGTTIVTNAVLENKLPRTALLTTAGFRDIMEIGRHFRPDMYDLQQDKPEPVVPRELRLEIDERVASDGHVLRRPDRGAFAAVVGQIRAHGAEAVAICFLNSFANPENEIAVRRWFEAELPDMLVSASCDVCREIREFERTSTVGLNAAAMPLVGRYLREIAPLVRQVLPNANILIMQSNGGSLTVDAARAYPARMITSGPAGGALAVQRMSRATSYPNLLGVDMGGTSTDISFIQDGALQMTTEAAIGGRPIKLPMIEINTIGAGAGSIAWLDSAKGLHVGPQSAGAEPGPVAYRAGGTEPTVTDANLVLGRLIPDRFASGRITLDVAAARDAIRARIADPLGMSVEQAAAGIIRIANANMERAVRVSSAEKGFDPRTITLVAFGGAGPMHAAALARAAGIPKVLVPEQPGVLSALGLVMTDIRHDFVQTRVLRAEEISAANLAPLFSELEKEGQAALAADGVENSRRDLLRSADLRYAGQAYEVNVPLPDAELSDQAVAELVDRFHALHKQFYAHNHPNRAVELVSARLTALGRMAAPPVPKHELNGADVAPRGEQAVYFEEAGGFLETALYDRRDLAPGSSLHGPAIVEQIDTTIVIHPDQAIEVDAFANLIVTTGGSQSAG